MRNIYLPIFQLLDDDDFIRGSIAVGAGGNTYSDSALLLCHSELGFTPKLTIGGDISFYSQAQLLSDPKLTIGGVADLNCHSIFDSVGKLTIGGRVDLCSESQIIPTGRLTMSEFVSLLSHSHIFAVDSIGAIYSDTVSLFSTSQLITNPTLLMTAVCQLNCEAIIVPNPKLIIGGEVVLISESQIEALGRILTTDTVDLHSMSEIFGTLVDSQSLLNEILNYVLYIKRTDNNTLNIQTLQSKIIEMQGGLSKVLER
jgi:hypothetical protein